MELLKVLEKTNTNPLKKEMVNCCVFKKNLHIDILEVSK